MGEDKTQAREVSDKRKNGAHMRLVTRGIYRPWMRGMSLNWVVGKLREGKI